MDRGEGWGDCGFSIVRGVSGAALLCKACAWWRGSSVVGPQSGWGGRDLRACSVTQH